MCVCNDAQAPGRGGGKTEERSIHTEKKEARDSDHTGTRGRREEGREEHGGRLIEEIEVQVREMRKENNEKGSTA